jgi:hypothetical protein
LGAQPPYQIAFGREIEPKWPNSERPASAPLNAQVVEFPHGLLDFCTAMAAKSGERELVYGGDGRDSGLSRLGAVIVSPLSPTGFPPQLFGGRPDNESAVDDKFRTGDEARFVGREE